MHRARRVQKYKRTLRPARRAVAGFTYHYRGERNHQGLGNAFVFLDTTGAELPDGWKPEVARQIVVEWSTTDPIDMPTEILDRAEALFKELTKRFDGVEP